MQRETTDTVGLKRALKWRRRFPGQIKEKKESLRYGYVEAVITKSPVLWAIRAQAFSDPNCAAVIVKAETMLVSPPEK